MNANPLRSAILVNYLSRFFVCAVLLICLTLCQSSDNMLLSMNALESFYNTTNGQEWSWVSGGAPVVGVQWNFSKSANGNYASNPCEFDMSWQGICCCNKINTSFSASCQYYLSRSHDYVTTPSSSSNCELYEEDTIVGLSLPLFDIYGSVPVDLFTLTTLTIFVLEHNYLTSTISAQISNLKNLTVIDVDTNMISGTIPLLSDLKSLVFIGLDVNMFSGSIGQSLAHLSYLEDIFLKNNYFTGTIPSYLGARLEHHPNNLTGLSLRNNYFTGTIPAGLCQSLSLSFFGLAENLLTGTIPNCLGDLTLLGFLWLYGNSLIGTIPELTNLNATLTNVLFYGNQLSGTLSPSLGVLSKLQSLDVSSNMLKGSVPASLGQLQALTLLSVTANQLSGTLPIQLSCLTNLQFLFASGNQMHGPVNELFAMDQTSLSVVDISDNNFSGSLPENLFALPKLQAAVLTSNCFTGSLSASMCLSTSLLALVLDGLSAGSACQMPLLFGSYTPSHYIVGHVPECLFEMPQLQVLQLSGNGILGSLPIGALPSNLVSLSLSSNQLTGNIPLVFQSHAFHQLDLSHNRLSGTIAQMTGFYSSTSPFNQQLSLNVNRLSGLLPIAFGNANNIEVVAGNLFGCRPNSKLPQHDPGTSTTECGSMTLNSVLISWSVVLVVVIGGCLIVLVRVERLQTWLRDNLTIALNIGNLFPNQLSFAKLFFAISTRLAQVIVLSTAAAIFVFLPFTLIAKSVNDGEYSTHSVQYAYAPSLAFVSGELSARATFILVALLMAGVRLSVKFSKTTNGLQTRNPVRAWSCLLVSRVAILCISNAILIFLINLGYLFVVFNFTTAIINVTQLALVVFKLLWNNYVLPAVVRRVDSLTNGPLLTFLMMVNTIVIPMLTTACIDPNCFQSLLVSSAPISEVYEYTIPCGGGAYNNGTCFNSQGSATRSFVPPFIYSYQCSSTMLSYYIPVYVLMYIYYAILAPLLSAGAMYLYWTHSTSSKLMWLLDNTVGYGVMRDRLYCMQTAAISDSTIQSNALFFNAQDVIVQMACHLAILLTFGMVYPILSLLICTAVLVDVWKWKVIIGCYLSHCQATQDECVQVSLLQKLNNSDIRIDGIVSFSSGVVVAIMTIFYSLFLVDMAGDKANDAIMKFAWAPLALIIWSLVVLLAHKLPMAQARACCLGTPKNVRDAQQESALTGDHSANQVDSSSAPNDCTIELQSYEQGCQSNNSPLHLITK